MKKIPLTNHDEEPGVDAAMIGPNDTLKPFVTCYSMPVPHVSCSAGTVCCFFRLNNSVVGIIS